MRGMPFQRKDDGSKVTMTCEGASEKDVFIDAGHALFDVIAKDNKIRGDVRQEIVLQAEDMSALFKAWLKELMSRVTDMGMLYADFDVFSIQKVGTSSVLTGALYGESQDQERHTVNTSARLNETKVTCNKKTGAVSCSFSFDIK